MKQLKLKIDVLAPQHVKVINYSGPNPNAIIKLAPTALKEVLRLSSTSLFTDKLKWDTSAKEIDFYGEWRGKDGKDNNTKLWFKIIAQGKLKEDNTGSVTIWLTSEMDTGFKYRYGFEYPLVLLYKKLLYSNQIKRYADEGRRNAQKIEQEIKGYFGIGG